MNYIIRESNEFGQDSDSLDRIKQEKNYISYLENHIANVKAAYERYFLPILHKDIDIQDALFTLEEFRSAIIGVRNEIAQHDKSKWSEYEFNQYRAHWDPTEEEKLRGQEYQNDVEANYMSAWKHHYENNDHHPKHWYDFENNIARDMALGAIIHMLCDWISFNLDSPGDTVKWWMKDATEERKFISPKTVSILEAILFAMFPEEYKKYKPVISSNINPILKDSENK